MINNITKHFLLKKENTRIPLTAARSPLLRGATNVKLQNQQISSINKILEAFFKKFLILISKPVYTNTPNGIKISLLYFLRDAVTVPNSKKNKKTVGSLKNKQQIRNKKGIVQKVYWNKFMSNILHFSPVTGEQVTPSTLLPKYNNFSRARLTFLVLLLSKLLKTNVQIELVRIKYVYHDSNILAQFLGINSHRVTYGRIKNLLWNRVTTLHRTHFEAKGKDTVNSTLATAPDGTSLSNTIISKDDFSPVTSLTGFKIKISGRLAKQRVVPKKTVKTTYKGAISPNKYNLVDEASYTGKNKKGAYTIRVWTSHGITS